MSRDKGVSEVLGYILVFTMVAFAVSLAYVYAIPQIQEQQEFSSFKSMESAFLILKTSSELVAFNITPSKVINLWVEKGVVHTSDRIRMILNTSDGNYTVNSLVYDLGGNKIILLADTLFECFGNDCIALTKPTVTNGSMTVINFQGNFALSGHGAIAFKNNGSIVREVRGVNVTFDAGYLSSSIARAFYNEIKIGELSGNAIEISENVTLAVHNVSVY